MLSENFKLSNYSETGNAGIYFYLFIHLKTYNHEKINLPIIDDVSSHQHKRFPEI
jgi:hypothetical protein